MTRWSLKPSVVAMENTTIVGMYATADGGKSWTPLLLQQSAA